MTFDLHCQLSTHLDGNDVKSLHLKSRHDQSEQTLFMMSSPVDGREINTRNQLLVHVDPIIRSIYYS